ncbi:FadR/GntR family transcriptional regulator [Paraflavisolibacter sp. H34]|uniref:FadR/GntR family transcriptional regulator n=1 Tax=Huijunlia imazamoxiresistens TaxID=3127457 RepID=UPI003018C5A7
MITKKSLSEEVAEKIREQIAGGRYLPGDRLPIEPELMKSFGVGRSTIREAIKLLTNAGLLRAQQGVGTFVEQAGPLRETMDQRLQRAKEQEVDEIRQLLELKIAEKAARNRTEEDLEKISQHLAARKAAAVEGSLADCVEADIAFHTAIAVASGNDILADLYRAAAGHLKQWFLSRYHQADFQKTYLLHERLFKAIRAADGEKAWKIASEIISK